MNEFFQRLKQRKLVQWAIAYVAAAFALLQGIDIVAQQFGWPEGVRRGITLGLVVGFFVTLVLAWYHGERGAQRVTGTELLIIGLVLALGGGLLWRFTAMRLPEDKALTTPNEHKTELAVTIPEKSIAVLPFENRSSDPENAFFTDGVQDEVLTHLARISDLKVISRTSVMQYKSGAARNLRKIGEELGVAHVMEGSVQRAGNKVRVNAQLIDARTDTHLWAQTYDRDLADVFAIQSEIASAIAEQLQAKLSANEKKAIEQRPTTDVTAFELYSRARTLMLTISLEGSYDKNLLQAIELLNSAVARDPSFHAAFCQLVFAHDQLYAVWDDHTPARLAAAKAALRRAAELRPNAAETHLARGSHLYRAFRDYTGALAELETARSGLPNDPRTFELTGYILRRQGRHEQAMRFLQQAIALDPRNAFMLGQLAGGYSILRRYAEEKAALKSALAIRPDAVGVAASLAYVDFASRGDTAPLLQLINRLRTERPATLPEVADNWFLAALAERDWKAAEEALVALGDGLFWGDGPISLDRPFGEALLARAMHDDERAHQTFLAVRKRQAQVVEEQKEFAAALCVLGLIDAALGSKEAALQEGHRAIELVPVDKNRVDHETLVAYFAMIAAWCGEKDLALQQLAVAVTTPGGGDITSYGMLKRSPFWEPLRRDPRFEKIVASLTPKENAASSKK